MALENPRDFDNGQIVTLDRTNVSRSNSKENHHFFPYSLHSKFNVDSTNINCLLNFVLISGRLNREISNKLPSVYLAGYSSSNIDIESHLKSHFINDEALKAAKNDDYHSFIQKRGESIMEMIKSKIDVDKFIEPEEDVIEESIEFDEVEELEGA